MQIPFEVATTKGSGDTSLQRAPSPEPQQSESACLPSRNKGSLTKWQQELRLLRDSQPEPFTNQSEPFLSNFCESNKVDLRSPSVNQIAEFLLHLLKERKLQPSTIEGYRAAIAEIVDNDKLNISKDEKLTCLLGSFHRDKPKERRSVPNWNLSLVLHQLT